MTQTKEVDIMSKVSGVLFPDGRLCSITGVEAYCEETVSLAGKSLRLMERARGFRDKPTALVFEIMSPDETHCFPAKRRAAVGNMPPALCEDIMREILTKGYYDFSDVVGMKTITTLQDKVSDSFSYYCPHAWNMIECSNIPQAVCPDSPYCDDGMCDDDDGEEEWSKG